MAKKKNSSKKHRYHHSESGQSHVSATTTQSTEPVISPATKTPRATAVTTNQRDYGYVSRDLRRIVIMAGGLVAVELVLYYVLLHTAAGPAIYSLVKV